MSDMKNAFDVYFEKQKSYSYKTYGKRPAVPYTDNLNKDLLLSAPDEDDYVEWEPQEQKEPLNFDAVEKKLAFKINDELRSYYSTYFFLGMDGKLGNKNLYFDPINKSEEIQALILLQYDDAQAVFPNTQIFLIGMASIDRDDNYFIYYDNASSELFCYESDTNKKVLFSRSLVQVIGEMEAFD